MTNINNEIVGIDVSSEKLDIYHLTADIYYSVANDLSGIKELYKRLKKSSIKLIVLESTGSYHKEVMNFLQDQSLPVALVNPRCVRDYAKAIGYLAKTDKIDSKVLALFGAATSPIVRAKVSAEVVDFRALVDRRNQVVKMITAEKLRLKANRNKVVGENIEASLLFLTKNLRDLNQEIKSVIDNNKNFAELFKVISSVPYVGIVLSSTLIAYMPELGSLTKEQVASLVGLAPFNKDSGKFKGQRSCKGGRVEVRNVLYMSVLAALKSKTQTKETYVRLKQKGKASKVAITACMRKLIILINSLVAKNTCWIDKLDYQKILTFRPILRLSALIAIQQNMEISRC